MKKKKEIVLHQHVNEKKIPFGKPHPIDAIHKKKSTQEAHDKTFINLAKEDFIRRKSV